MKKMYIPLIVSSIFFSSVSVSSEINRYIVNVPVSSLEENMISAFSSLEADIIYLSFATIGKNGEVLGAIEKPKSLKIGSMSRNDQQYVLWTNLKKANPEKKFLLRIANIDQDTLTRLGNSEFVENTAANIVFLLRNAYPVYRMETLYGDNPQSYGSVFLNGIDLSISKNGRLTESESYNILKLAQLIRQKLASGGSQPLPENKPLLSFTTSGETADPTECITHYLADKCSFSEQVPAQILEHSGEALTVLTRGKELFDIFNVKVFSSAKFRYDVAMSNFSRAVGDAKKVILQPEETTVKDWDVSLERAVWQAENKYGGFSVPDIGWAMVGGGGTNLAGQIEHINAMKQAADKAKTKLDKPAAPVDLQAYADVQTKTIELAWQPATESSGVVSYRVYRNGVNIDSVKAAHWSDTSVQPGTKYHYYVLAINAAGGVSPASNHVIAEVPAEQSQEKPLAPTGLSVSAVTQTALDIQWQPVTNVAIGQYTVYRDGHKVQSSDALSFHDSGLTANTAYTYSIVAQSAKGDLSELSMPLRVLTLADPASQPPAVAAWESGVAYQAGDVVTYNGNQYQCLQKHDSMQEWNPEAAQSLWKRMK